MKASDHFLKDVLSDRAQWVIPVYQRHYSWQTSTGRRQIQRMWEDISSRADEIITRADSSVRPHFVGAIIFEPAKGQTYGEVPIHYVVDGQQRLTTFNLFLAALRDVARDRGLAGHVAALEEYLFNPSSDAMRDPDRDHYKLWSSLRDREHFKTLVGEGREAAKLAFPDAFRRDGKPYKYDAPRMIRAYFHFIKQIEGFLSYWSDPEAATDTNARDDVDPDRTLRSETDAMDALMRSVLDAFAIVVIKLEDSDDAQGIFKSLNGYNEPLTVFDLVRNDIFQRALASGDNEEKLYTSVWMGIEGDFWDTEITQGRSSAPRSEHFISHFTTTVSREILPLRDVPDTYEAYVRDKGFDSVEDEIRHLLSFAEVYRRLEEPQAEMPEHDISVFMKTWDMTTFHPAVLAVGRSDINDDEKAAIYDRLISYVVRRDLLHLTRKSYNKVVLSLLSAFAEKGVSIATVDRWMEGLDGENSRMPSDEDIQRAVQSYNSYSITKPRLRHILARLERELRDDRQELMSLHDGELHIEHILPASWHAHWPLSDGTLVAGETYALHLEGSGSQLSDDQQREMHERESLKNSLGNLTILTRKLNQEVSNSGWNRKCSDEGLGASTLRLNRDICRMSGRERPAWSHESIKARGHALASLINKIWPASGGTETLAASPEVEVRHRETSTLASA